MQVGEKIAVGGLAKEFEEECPYIYEVAKEVSEEEDENVADDDLEVAAEEQKNNGGTLGGNIINASTGKKGTCEGPYPADDWVYQEDQWDTSRANVWVKVPKSSRRREKKYPFTVAAHHLIPGNASLRDSELKKYMTDGEKITQGGFTFTIVGYIGYNVNGAHNGVWLPGNYAITEETSPDGKPWSKCSYTEEDWAMNYVASVCKAIGRQFHDTHGIYNQKVETLLNKIATVLDDHVCYLCESETEVAPPFAIKNRLYALSDWLMTKLEGHPNSWKKPWYTSERWGKVLENKSLRKKFISAYNAAKVV